VDGNEPLAIGLFVTGDLADLERLKREGIFDDYVTVVESVRPIAK
jgi:hypothetical protein